MNSVNWSQIWCSFDWYWSWISVLLAMLNLSISHWYMLYWKMIENNRKWGLRKIWILTLPIHIEIISKRIELETCAWSQMKRLSKGFPKLVQLLIFKEYEEEISLKQWIRLLISPAWQRTFYHFEIGITNHQNQKPYASKCWGTKLSLIIYQSKKESSQLIYQSVHTIHSFADISILKPCMLPPDQLTDKPIIGPTQRNIESRARD